MVKDNKKFDILVIRDYYPSYQNPTSSTWVFQQVKFLYERGFNPLVISPVPYIPLRGMWKLNSVYEKPKKEIDSYEKTSVIRPPYLKIPNNKLTGFTLKQLEKVIDKYGKIDSIKLIHSHFGQNGIAAVKLKLELKVPLVTSFYGYDTGRLGKKFLPYYKQLIQYGDLFLVLSEDMKEDLINLGFPAERTLIHHLGVDTDEFNINRNSTKKNSFKLLTIARLDEGKGIHIVLKALQLLFDIQPAMKQIIKYIIVGGGEYEDNLKRFINEYNLSDNVEMINNLGIKNGREIVKEQLRNSDIFILCSYLTKKGTKEGTPVVLMEAQSCGLPCIATRHAGIPEVIIDGKSGILVKERCPEEIYQAILFLYENKEIEESMKIQARKNIIDNFNQKTQMDKLCFEYNKLLKQ
jgi:colanic acid/amylovoran biosynthesis glycosyltransferase